MDAIIFSGIQATGKSTFYKLNFFNSHVRLSMDLLKTRKREQLFLNICLLTKQKFVIDNTNPTAEERSRYIIPAKEKGYKITGYYFAPDIRQVIARNQEREGKMRIPVAGIFGTLKRMQVPGFKEGFDELFYVTSSDNNFILTKWNNRSVL
jgi:predicted kinase